MRSSKRKKGNYTRPNEGSKIIFEVEKGGACCHKKAYLVYKNKAYLPKRSIVSTQKCAQHLKVEVSDAQSTYQSYTGEQGVAALTKEIV